MAHLERLTGGPSDVELARAEMVIEMAAAPFEAMIMNTSSEICWPRSIGMPIALETKSAAIVR